MGSKLVHNYNPRLGLPARTLAEPVSFFFFPGEHLVEWRYERLAEGTESVPLAITSIRVEGTGKGSADTCVACPKVRIDTDWSRAHSALPAVLSADNVLPERLQTKRVIRCFTDVDTGCERCGDGYFKSELMATCDKCPLHTRSTDNNTKQVGL